MLNFILHNIFKRWPTPGIQCFCEPIVWYNRLMSFNWQHKDWPNFSYDLSSLEQSLFLFSERMGRTSGLLEGLSEDDQTASMIDMMVVEAVKTSEIEGEMMGFGNVLHNRWRSLKDHRRLKRTSIPPAQLD